MKSMNESRVIFFLDIQKSLVGPKVGFDLRFPLMKSMVMTSSSMDG